VFGGGSTGLRFSILRPGNTLGETKRSELAQPHHPSCIRLVDRDRGHESGEVSRHCPTEQRGQAALINEPQSR
jgi:hypothetical protein